MDAKQLYALEKFMGEGFVGVDGLTDSITIKNWFISSTNQIENLAA